MPTLKIDNREITVPSGTKVIEAAERLGIVIPRFCYHPALGAVGACRVCAVAFKEGPVKGVQMSCMVDARDGMVVSTTDADAVDFRRHVIEFLMLNHPHDCPVCDEGGHCLLQDLTVAGGHGLRRYQGLKRTHRNQDLGPLVQHEMNRCIQCYRCSRYYQEFSGYRDLGVMGIGSRVYFGRAASGALESPFAGNLVDICPTGVYTDKPSRYIGRRWDFERRPTICVHCSLGCNLTASARYRQVVRHEARPNAAVNGYFICDRGRHAYAYAGAAQRPRQALLSGIPTGLDAVLSGARNAIQEAVDRSRPASVAVVASERCSLETLGMIRHACSQKGWTGPSSPSGARRAANLKTAVGRLTNRLAVSLADIADADDVLVIGADPINEAPMLAMSLRQVRRRGGRVTVIDPRGVDLPFDFEHWPLHPEEMTDALSAVAQHLDARTACTTDAPSATAQAVASLAKRLDGGARPMVVCGTDIVTPVEVALAADIAGALQSTHHRAGLFYVLGAADSFGMVLTGGLPAAMETVVERIETGAVRALVAVDADLWHTFPDRRRLESALDRLDLLVVLDHADSPLNARAGYFVPTRTIYESGGHWINQEGRLQAARVVMAGGDPIAVTGGGDHPPRVFGTALPGGDPVDAGAAVDALIGGADAAGWLAAALDELPPAVVAAMRGASGGRLDLQTSVAASHAEAAWTAGAPLPEDAVTLLLVDRTFGTEPLSAATPALEALETAPTVRIHPETAAELGLTTGAAVVLSFGDDRLRLPVEADGRMARRVLVVPRHHRLDWQVAGETRLAVGRSQITAEDA